MRNPVEDRGTSDASFGGSTEDVSRFLDHRSVAVTTVGLRRLKGQADSGWAKVAAAIGM